MNKRIVVSCEGSFYDSTSRCMVDCQEISPIGRMFVVKVKDDSLRLTVEKRYVVCKKCKERMLKAYSYISVRPY